MMQHYLMTKDEYPDCILFYRLGDFYEMFFDDALTVSRELELTLTGKDCGMEERAPMCGVPFHAAETYINRLIEKGYKAAICEQVEDPRQAKGMVKREVVRVVTPGTTLNTQALDETKNNYIMSLVYIDEIFGIAVADVTTGDCFLTEVNKSRKLLDEINKFSPAEIICNEPFYMCGIDIQDMRNRLGITVYSLDNWYFDDELCRRALLEHFRVKTLEGLGLKDYDCGVIAAGALFQYLTETQKTSLSHMTTISPYITDCFMLIDSSSRRNLELVETLREKQKRGSLLWVLDKTKTAMGARMLRSFVEQPLIEEESINRRLDAIEELNEKAISREEIREYLGPVYDLERLVSRVSYQSANPRDLIAFKSSLQMLPYIRQLLGEFSCGELVSVREEMDDLQDLFQLIDRAIMEEPPLAMKEGGIIKEGYNEEVDKFRRAKTEGKSMLAELETKERESTGIKNLKVKYNKVFGYYLEVTNSFLSMVPDSYTRKQTLTNAERFITPELKELEDTILGAEDKLFALEYELFAQVRETIAKEVLRIQKTAKAIARLDVFSSLSVVAQRNQYIRPKINTKGVVDIKGGRHPVVEKMISNDMFIPNDTYLDNNKNRVSVITGPNMAGKSTYMRQTALIVLMAQVGCFVPAKEANIGIVDRIFTRVGASDDLASGQSTFMVEMTEVANILRNATPKSLLILDEIGRGTSTFDGLSIAWAVIEHISNPKLLGAKTLFATHYHELTELEGKLSGVNNYCIAVKEKGDDIVFLRKIVKGGADKSYGIQVAKLAGVPETVIERAKELVEELSDADITSAVKEIAADSALTRGSRKKAQVTYDQMELDQISLLDTVQDNDILEELKNIDVGNLTPIDALNTIYRLQTKLKNRW
ncbi:DNA mismatch repair protein MutS [Lactonifactor sp. BIOML-A3]|nr:DNA mismatch repair protein MutS [Lactonifactor sp. BIOML-A5]MSA10041.1 DNA mismatch repair protein MutS [Lactonifactor sp. BIOML-A4]MSA13191.1 DNA mismatch repair protein MutS [Lactonifactor sp. BIOML-A3]MSA18969.1 DNA mismatch repair protein MutS [Lactonifactor sp. BIOML-A2]MSA38755.1 DNA mismatch repair protein MutS [Lactonifactor sp. BIOML-A1]MSB14421.1 DNA mismatch repair protein MutS [Lactonifactor sp. BIOML-A6]MSB69794.1 DNA mismatch repair protein MutS [Lactonifactor sp. BIOML-A7]